MNAPIPSRPYAARLLLGLAFSISACLALAHTDEYFDKQAAPHGGQIRMAGPYHMELVVDTHQLALYVTDHGDDAIASDGGSAKAIVTTGKNRFVVILRPAGENILRGTGDYQLGAYNEISVMLALPGQTVQRAAFVYPKGAKPPAKKARKKRHRAA
jgi:hypothetical protein